MKSNPRVWVVIPARGGSKGVPLKNLSIVGNRTLVRRAVETALASSIAHKVLVSTDSPAIAAEAERAGGTVIIRPAELSGDLSTSESTLVHALAEVGADDSDLAVMMQCTSPFVTPTDLVGVVNAVIDGADSAFAAAPFHRFIWRTDDQGVGVGINHESWNRPRRQDRGLEWLETGGAYAFSVGGFRSANHRFFGRVVPVPSAAYDLEIDDTRDLIMARLLCPVETPIWPWGELPKLLVLDFDGVLTDDRVWTDQEGVESVACSRNDGMGIQLLREVIPIVVLSTEINPVVAARCAKLGIECVQGLGDKKGPALVSLASSRGIRLLEVAYVGNDVNDQEPLNLAGFPIVVSDAHAAIVHLAGLKLTKAGGKGAVRELTDLLLNEFKDPSTVRSNSGGRAL